MSQMPVVGGMIGRYEVVRVLGQGGMGVVYEGRDPSLDRSVAIKVVLPSLSNLDNFRARFAREAATLARIRSQYIVKIIEYGDYAGMAYLVTEYVPDGDLQTIVDREGAFAPLTALRLVAQLCEALQDAHDAGIVHRDVKPNNVLVWRRKSGLVPYLCDFGISTDGNEGLTTHGTVIGTLRYMAPERHHGLPADHRGDVYSMGCLLHALLTGRAPYSGSSDFQVMSAHLHHPIPVYDGRSPHDWLVNGLLQQAMAKDPAERFQSAAAMARAAEQVVEHLTRAGMVGA